ncbi:BrnA antitoxin family protein [Kaistia granuli]|uniref:BrnA antitoxin family protein n=1 Tax=Kaistia granuli TaxID=363259 RepID=UPI0003616D3B|nr:BrnA antitoxin family protein [Kaistia granuli]
MVASDMPAQDDAPGGDDHTVASPARRRSAKADGMTLVTVSLALSERVIDYFKTDGGDWQARINETLNLLVNRQNARDAKKRARLRARGAIRRRPGAAAD